MASAIRLKQTLRNAMLDELNAAIGAGGFLRFYDGAQPTNADTALGAQVQLAQLALSATPFAVAGSGAIVANAITNDAAADATGTATWFSFVTSAGVRIFDGTLGTSGADINLNTVSLVVGALVSVTSFTLNFAAA